MNLFHENRLDFFRQGLLGWYEIHRRSLPWRERYDPYATWIAEVMLQQTQMDRGLSYLQRWMVLFPDLQSVAEAREEELLKAWEGLGYYRRVRQLQAAARLIMERHHGVFPDKIEDLRALPGIGPYTAGAIASTAFGQDVPCVDGNAERVLARVFDIDSPPKQEPAKSRILELASTLIPPGRARDFNQALMEFGSLTCRKKALCESCPFGPTQAEWHEGIFCESRRLNIVGERPVRGRTNTVRPVLMATGVLAHRGKIFVQRREDEGIWGGLWEFPGGCLEAGETPEEAVVREWMEETGFATEVDAPLTVIRHGYTSYRITLHAFRLKLAQDLPGHPAPPVLTEATDCAWVSPDALERLPLPAPHRKLADLLTAEENKDNE